MITPLNEKRGFVIQAPSEPRKIELFSPAYYGTCTAGGVMSCGLTHLAVTPLDLVKCNMQVLRMENAKFEMLSSVKSVVEQNFEDECIIKLVEERGIKETAFALKRKQCELINIVSGYINSMKPRIERLETMVFYEQLQEDAYGSDVKKTADVEKIVVPSGSRS